MRVLLDELTGAVGPVAEEDLAGLYDAPESWLRMNFVATVDGAATGSDGRSGSINNPVDKRVFHLLRRMSDAIIVGAGTARAEGYGVVDRPIVVLSRHGSVPDSLRGGPPGSVLLVTSGGGSGAASGAAPGGASGAASGGASGAASRAASGAASRAAGRLEEAREMLGAENVLELGSDEVDLGRLRPVLAERGLTRLLSEGGPQVFHAMLEAGIVDELDLTWVPRLVAGGGLRILSGAALDVALSPQVLLEADGTMLGRWFLGR